MPRSQHPRLGRRIIPLFHSGLESTSKVHFLEHPPIILFPGKFSSWRINNPSIYYGVAHNDDPSIFVSTLLSKYQPLVEQLYSDGVRKFLFLNCPPITRSPHTHEENDSPEQFQRHAAMVAAYNDGLRDMVHRFSDDHNDVSTFTDFYTVK